MINRVILANTVWLYNYSQWWFLLIGFDVTIVSKCCTIHTNLIITHLAVLTKQFESEIKFMLKLQEGKFLTMSKSDLSGVWACFTDRYMPNRVRFAHTMTEHMAKTEINHRLKRFYKNHPLLLTYLLTRLYSKNYILLTYKEKCFIIADLNTKW